MIEWCLAPIAEYTEWCLALMSPANVWRRVATLMGVAKAVVMLSASLATAILLLTHKF